MTLGLARIERPWDDTSGGSVSLATAINSVPRTLPLDLCEAIIDRCAPPTWWESWSENQWSESVVRSARTLIACALTCHDWTARSRFNYYSFCVILRDAEDVDRFTDIIRRNPSIADFVRIFTVASSVWADDTSSWSNPGRSGQYVPFARTMLSRQLRNLHTVAYLRNLPWPFPTSCNLHIAQYRSLSTLYLCAQFRRPIDLCRLVWALEKLQRLHLYRSRSAASTLCLPSGACHRLEYLGLFDVSVRMRIRYLSHSFRYAFACVEVPDSPEESQES
ncbi:hypothetical protein PYCCODRAFT_1262887 [Trametes coccinea BRFM310]|uniref:F-box domain-containing protein n=1 Tax=Trametes coccinea (strain BRFM310) TaxID=1353009 RepID=A0A1Y2I692_TRAC3|nr:hypothetical protein PYCCODRAFT_1262887 [Trametes coccinea BRFM310]